MKTKTLLYCLLLSASSCTLADTTSWQIHAGISLIDPTSSPGSILGGAGVVTISDQPTPTLSIARFISPHLAIDLLGGIPPKHRIYVNGAKAGATRPVPPTLSLQYHFTPDSRIRPYIGVGMNYTNFVNEKLDGGGKLRLSDSWGLAGKIGIDYGLDRNWSIGADIRYADINTKVSINGADVGHVDVDPMIYTLNIGYRF